MIHTDVTSTWVYEHFLMYLYICIADVDCLISDKELVTIRDRVLSHLDEERCLKLSTEVFKEYRQHTEDERKEYIKENVPKFLRTESIKRKVINDLADIVPENTINNEGLEQVMFRYIRKIINVAK